MKDRVTGDPRGFAFVIFQDATTVDLVMNEPRHEINHKIVDVKRAQARGVAPPSIHHGGGGEGGGGDDSSTAGVGGRPPQRGNSHNSYNSNSNHNSGGNDTGMTPEQLHTKVFVGGIPPHIDKDELKTIFEQYGPVTDAIIMIDQITNRSRCFGFVTFENGSDGAEKAVAAQPVQIGNRKVEVKLATPKADQKRQAPTAAGPKHVGLRAGMSSASATGPYAGLAVSFGRNGWKAGYGTKAFGKAGWAVEGWDDGGFAPEKSGFSFDMLQPPPPSAKNNDSRASSKTSRSRHRQRDHNDGPPSKRSRR